MCKGMIKLDQEETNAIVTCPNCGGTHMIERKDAFACTDKLERFCIAAATYMFSSILFFIIHRVFAWLGIDVEFTIPLRILYWGAVVAVGLWLSYSLTSRLNRERRRNDGIDVWYAQCDHCHEKFRLVRPYGSIPPCETAPKVKDDVPGLLEILGAHYETDS